VRLRRISIAVLLLCVAGVVLTMQRSVWLAAGAATVVTVATMTGQRRKAIKGVVAVALAVGLALLAIPGLYSDISARFDDDRTVHDRENLARAAVNMVDERPLLGFGWGQFVTESPPYFEQAEDFPLGNIAGTPIHSTGLTYLVELGLIGAALWVLCLLFGVGGGLLRRGPPDLDDWRVGLLAVAVLYAVIENFVPPQSFPNLALWLWAGVAWVGYQAPAEEET
jgi:O-antigen ligase